MKIIKYKKKIIFFLIIVISKLNCFYCQIKPPESYKLIRGVNENLNLNLGYVNLDIPLFNVDMEPFKFKNSLSYESRGFVPDLPTSYVGLNWNLDQFGKITRESNRIDFTTVSSVYLNSVGSEVQIKEDLNNEKGYYRNDCIDVFFPPSNFSNSYKKNIYNNPYENDYHASIKLPNILGYFGKSYSFNPDKYFFDFMGYQGYFVVDNEGQPLVYCEKAKLLIDISKYGCHDIFGNISFSEIRITDDQGNQYFFGGNTSALDINYSYNRTSVEDIAYTDPSSFSNNISETKTNYIDSWLLKKIVFKNGETAEGFYRNPDLSLLNSYRGGYKIKKTYFTANTAEDYEINTGFPKKSELLQNDISVVENRTFTYFDYHGFCTPACGLSKKYQVNTYTKKAVLDSIRFRNVSIEYNYEVSQNSQDLSNKYLKQIILKVDNTNNKIINLNYENLGSNNQRNFLKNINFLNGEKIYFDYYNTENFPDILWGSLAKTKQGLWDGRYVTNYQDFSVADDSKFNAGLLKSVTYPTKGTTTYFYETGDISKIYRYEDYYNGTPPKLFNENRNVIIPRISKKEEYDFSKTYTTFYNYKNNNGLSSGIIEDNYNENFDQVTTNVNLVPNINTTNSLYYSTVTVTTEGKGYIKSYFSDRVTNPDILTSKNFHSNESRCNNNSYYNWHERYRIYTSKKYERGKILKEEIYGEDNFKIKEKNYKYTNLLEKFPSIDLLSNCTDCRISDLNYYVRTIATDPNVCNIQTLYVPVLPYLQSSVQTKEFYRDGKTIETNEYTSYNEKIAPDKLYWHPNPVEKKIVDATGTTSLKYLYPIDLYKKNGCEGRQGCVFVNDNTIVGGQYVVYDALYKSNINLPIIKILSKNNKFSLTENLWHPTIQYSQEPKAIKRLRHSSKDTQLDFTNYKISSDKMIDGDSFDHYDNKYNCVQMTDKTGLVTTTIYGYSQSLPIAKIVGASYNDVLSVFQLNGSDYNKYTDLDIVEKSNLDIDTISEQQLITALDTFRSKTEFKNYQITTYTHNPLIGVTSITPPSGIREIYIYDTANRLEKVVNINGNILKEIKYNFKQ